MKKLFLVLILIVAACVFAVRYFMPPKISVVMSTYNRADLLPRAIESILNQTFTDFEFIIIVDGSKDGSVEIVKRYAERDKRIKLLINEKNQGLVYSLNRGIDEARGKYIARMDDDDISLMDRFAKQHFYMERNPHVAVVASWVSNINNNDVLQLPNETDPDRIKILAYLGTTPIEHPTAFIRKSFLDEHNLRYREDFKYLEDRVMWVDIMNKGGIIVALPEILVRFRVHLNNSKKYYKEQFANSVLFQRELFKQFFDGRDFENMSPKQRLQFMVELNKTKKILHQQKFNDMAKDFIKALPNSR